MSAALQILIGALATVLSAAIIAFLKRFYSFHKEHTVLMEHLEETKRFDDKMAEMSDDIKKLWDLQEAQSEGIRALLGKALDQEHGRLVSQGYASPTEKERFEKDYKAYHANGGNGTRTAHYEDVMKMKSYKS